MYKYLIILFFIILFYNNYNIEYFENTTENINKLFDILFENITLNYLDVNDTNNEFYKLLIKSNNKKLDELNKKHDVKLKQLDIDYNTKIENLKKENATEILKIKEKNEKNIKEICK